MSNARIHMMNKPSHLKENLQTKLLGTNIVFKKLSYNTNIYYLKFKSNVISFET